MPIFRVIRRVPARLPYSSRHKNEQTQSLFLQKLEERWSRECRSPTLFQKNPKMSIEEEHAAFVAMITEEENAAFVAIITEEENAAFVVRMNENKREKPTEENSLGGFDMDVRFMR